MESKYFIVEGGNATGKSTLIDGLLGKIKKLTALYSIPEEYNSLRKYTYDKWSDKASLYFYLSANIELFDKLKGDFVVFDRSIISTFSIYLSRIPEEEWIGILPLYKDFLCLLPTISKVFLLIANDSTRKKRIDEKSGNDKIADLKELKYEKIKDKARLFLLKNSEVTYYKIDTSNLTKENVLNLVYKEMIK